MGWDEMEALSFLSRGCEARVFDAPSGCLIFTAKTGHRFSFFPPALILRVAHAFGAVGMFLFPFGPRDRFHSCVVLGGLRPCPGVGGSCLLFSGPVLGLEEPGINTKRASLLLKTNIVRQASFDLSNAYWAPSKASVSPCSPLDVFWQPLLASSPAPQSGSALHATARENFRNGHQCRHSPVQCPACHVHGCPSPLPRGKMDDDPRFPIPVV